MREFGSEFEIEYLPDNYFRQLSQLIPSHAFTRSGREAIGMAIAGIKPGVALLPAYCCWSMVLPFEAAGWIVAYYPLNEDLSVKIPQLVTTVKELKPQVVLVMDYYGFAPTVAAVNAIKESTYTLEYPSLRKCSKVFSNVPFSPLAIGDKTIVFVHGLSDNLYYWQKLSFELGKDYKVLSYDLRGHGSSPYAHFTMDELADELHDLLLWPSRNPLSRSREVPLRKQWNQRCNGRSPGCCRQNALCRPWCSTLPFPEAGRLPFVPLPEDLH